MCLYIDLENHSEVPAILEIFKVVIKKSNGDLVALFQREFQYKIGMNEAVGDIQYSDQILSWNIQEYTPTPLDIISNNRIDAGVLHCFIDELSAQKYAAMFRQANSLIVKMYGLKEDFVAFGTKNEIAYKKLLMK